MTTNILFLGAPGTGKSTLAHGLTYSLSTQHLHVAYVEESAKAMCYREQSILLSNQLYVSALLWESIMTLQDKCDVLICDSHPLVGLVYTSPFYKEVLNLELLYKSINKSISIVVEPLPDLERDYVYEGRQQDYQGSMTVWKCIKEEVLPLLDKSSTLYVNRNIPIDELTHMVINLIKY